MAETKIEWADYTFNHVRGCTKVSPGCANCYAEAMSKRNPSTLGTWGPQGTRVVAAENYWKLPLKWDREAKAAGERRRVFCASLADIFEDWTGPMVDTKGNRLAKAECWDRGGGYIPTDLHVGRDLVTMADVRVRLWHLILRTPNLNWLLLTKRPENVARMLGPKGVNFYAVEGPVPCPQPNVWIGTTVEDRKHGLPRIDALRNTPAAVRFLSCEPLLEDLGTINLNGIHWLIAGGESGPHARPMHPNWARNLRDQCQAAGVAFHFKQWGAWLPKPMGDWKTKDQLWLNEAQGHLYRHGHLAKNWFPDYQRLLDGRTWDEFPA